jgi:hypothetical protein
MADEIYDAVLDLLVVPPSDKPIYLVVKTKRYSDDDGLAYFYNEHTCPTNWIGDVEAIIFEGDSDPHGVAQFVRRVDLPSSVDDVDDLDLPSLFPEAFAEGMEIDGELMPAPLPKP